MLSLIKLYFWFTEVKLTLHGFHQVKIINIVFLQFKRHPEAVVHRCFIKKAVPKNLVNFTRASLYRSPFLSSCRPRTCNFIKIEGAVQVFCCQFYELFQNNFMQTSCERLFLEIKKVLWKVNAPEIKIYHRSCSKNIKK